MFCSMMIKADTSVLQIDLISQTTLTCFICLVILKQDWFFIRFSAGVIIVIQTFVANFELPSCRKHFELLGTTALVKMLYEYMSVDSVYLLEGNYNTFTIFLSVSLNLLNLDKQVLTATSLGHPVSKIFIMNLSLPVYPRGLFTTDSFTFI